MTSGGSRHGLAVVRTDEKSIVELIFGRRRQQRPTLLAALAAVVTDVAKRYDLVWEKTVAAFGDFARR